MYTCFVSYLGENSGWVHLTFLSSVLCYVTDIREPDTRFKYKVPARKWYTYFTLQYTLFVMWSWLECLSPLVLLWPGVSFGLILLTFPPQMSASSYHSFASLVRKVQWEMFLLKQRPDGETSYCSFWKEHKQQIFWPWNQNYEGKDAKMLCVAEENCTVRWFSVGL